MNIHYSPLRAVVYLYPHLPIVEKRVGKIFPEDATGRSPCGNLVGKGKRLAGGRTPDAPRPGCIPTPTVGTRRIWGLLIGVLLLAACSQPQIEPLRVQAIPWTDGERSIYQITDINSNFAGTATLEFTAGATQVAEEAWTLHREVTAQGDQETVVVEMSAAGLRPVFSTLVRVLGGNARQQVKATYRSGQVDLELTTAQDVTTYERVNIPSDARDQRTLMALARALPLATGYATQVNSFLPIANLLERTTITVVGQEQVQTPAGTYEAWHIELRAPDSESEAWIATGPPYLLVKFTDGRTGGTYELREYQAGQ